MIGINGHRLDDQTRKHLDTIRPGSVILFSRNIQHRDQTQTLIEEIKASVDPSPLIAIDQEGGLVVRFFGGITVMPGNMALGAAGSSERAFQQGVLTAQELKGIGIDINLAPVVDVVTGYDNPGITVRSFGADPLKVAALGKSLILGTQYAGVAAVAKHFPGKGSASKDAHYDLPRVDDSWKNLEDCHLLPFRQCVEAGVRGVMSTHVLYTHFRGSEDVPPTLSRDMIHGYLRKELAFDGVIFSDDMEMGAIAKFFPFEEAIVQTALAGHDMILVCSDYDKQRRAFETLRTEQERGGALAEGMERSVRRIQELREWCRQQPSSGAVEASTEARNLAKTIARESITVVAGDVPIPLSGAQQIHAIIPDLSTVDSREEGLEAGEDNVIKRMLEAAFSERIQVSFVGVDATEAEIQRTVHHVQKADLLIIVIFNARYEAGQRTLVQHVKGLQVRTVFVLIRNPFDLELLGEKETAIITYGYRRVQLAAAIEVLNGAIEAKGTLPFLVRE